MAACIVEFRIAQPDGLEPRWLLSSGQSRFVNDQCVRFSGVLQDIHTQRLATQALRQLNEMLGERVERRTRERDRLGAVARLAGRAQQGPDPQSR